MGRSARLKEYKRISRDSSVRNSKEYYKQLKNADKLGEKAVLEVMIFRKNFEEENGVQQTRDKIVE